MKYVFVYGFLACLAAWIVVMGARARKYNLYKEYSKCYNLVLTDRVAADRRLDSSIGKCTEIGKDDFVCKLAILKLFCELDLHKEDLSSLEKIDPKEIFCRDGKFDSRKASVNGDSLYFICLDMMAALKEDRKNVIEALHDRMADFSDDLRRYEEYHLMDAVYASLTGSGDRGAQFYDYLLSDERSSVYDRQISSIYRNTALVMKKYIGSPLSEKEEGSFSEFAKTLLGSLIINKVGL